MTIKTNMRVLIYSSDDIEMCWESPEILMCSESSFHFKTYLSLHWKKIQFFIISYEYHVYCIDMHNESLVPSCCELNQFSTKRKI